MKFCIVLLISLTAFVVPPVATGGDIELYGERYVCLQERTLEEANEERRAAERLLHINLSKRYYKFCLKTEDPKERFAHYLHIKYRRKYRTSIVLASIVSPIPLILASSVIAGITASHRRTEREEADSDEGYTDEWKSSRITGMVIIATIGVGGFLAVFVPTYLLATQNKKKMDAAATLMEGRTILMNSDSVSLRLSVSGLEMTF